MPLFIFRRDVVTRWFLGMVQDRFCAAWLMYPHRNPDDEKLCCKQRVPALWAMMMG